MCHPAIQLSTGNNTQLVLLASAVPAEGARAGWQRAPLREALVRAPPLSSRACASSLSSVQHCLVIHARRPSAAVALQVSLVRSQVHHLRVRAGMPGQPAAVCRLHIRGVCRQVAA